LRDGLAVMDRAVDITFEAGLDDDARAESATLKVAGDGLLWSAGEKRRWRAAQAARVQLAELIENPDRWDRATVAQICDAYRTAKLTQSTSSAQNQVDFPGSRSEF
jgi:hypothetical protein